MSTPPDAVVQATCAPEKVRGEEMEQRNLGTRATTPDDVISDVRHMHELFDAAVRACDEGASTSDFEPTFAALLHHLEHHPGCAAQAEKRFVDGTLEGTLPWELVSFCMHRLRLEAVRQAAQRALEALRGPRGAQDLCHILESFDDLWDDADMYDLFKGGPPPPAPEKTPV